MISPKKAFEGTARVVAGQSTPSPLPRHSAIQLERCEYQVSRCRVETWWSGMSRDIVTTAYAYNHLRPGSQYCDRYISPGNRAIFQ